MRNYPRVLFGGLAIAGAIYFLVTVGASAVVPTADLASSDGPLLEVVRQGPLGINEKVFSAIGLLALSNGALINMIMASRLLYGMSSEGVVPAPLGIVNSATRTPWVAILFTTAIARRAGDHGRPREARRHHRRPARRRLRDRPRARCSTCAATPSTTTTSRCPAIVPVIGIGDLAGAADPDRGQGLGRGSGSCSRSGLALYVVNWLVVRRQDAASTA